MEAQLQIRQEAQEKQDVLNDLLRWQPETQKRSGVKAASIRPAGPAVPGNQAGLAPLRSSSISQGKHGSQSFAPNILRESATTSIEATNGSAAGHTYDKASSKWDKFDYDSALAEADKDENSSHKQSFSFPKGAKSEAPSSRKSKPLVEAGPERRQQNLPVTSGEPTDAELWKDRGNKAFAAKKYAQAKKDYTQSIALQPTCLAYANRAMAELKLDEFSAAESDCTAAIALDPCYVKAYLRRATAAKALGKLLAAAEDYENALRLEPTSKSTLADRQACMDQVLLQEGLQGHSPRVAIPIRQKPMQNQDLLPPRMPEGPQIPNGPAAQQQDRSSPTSRMSSQALGKDMGSQQAPHASQQGKPEIGGSQTLSAEQQQKLHTSQQGRAGLRSSSSPATPSAGMHAGPSHQAPLYRRRAEPSVVIEELPLDEQEEPPKPKASSELSTGHSAHQQAISASNITAMPLGPASAEATGAAKKQRNGPGEESQKVMPGKVPDRSSPAGTPSSNARAAASPSTTAASADTEGAQSSGQNLPEDASLSTERSDQLRSVAHQQADLHANGSAPTAAPQANGRAAERQQPQQQLQQQQQASKAAQEAESVAQNEAAGGRDRAPAKAHAGNTTGVALAAPRSGSEFEVGWKRLKGNTAGQEAFLRLLDPLQLPALFKQSLTAPVLSGIALAALSMVSAQDDHFGMQLLEGLKSVPRFDMIVMSLPKREKAALKEQFDAAQNAGVLDSVVENRLGNVRRSYRV
ncbi:MAG: hypothetical protein FRX49_07031 [Trebouxia sp. A1-2]|nr:MAG: hypothetical protein FRX49_07031 [Trebouxia sp. A1-2]